MSSKWKIRELANFVGGLAVTFIFSMVFVYCLLCSIDETMENRQIADDKEYKYARSN